MFAARFFVPVMGLLLVGSMWIASGGEVRAQQASTSGDLAAAAYELSQAARTEKQFTEVINLCKRALAATPSEKKAIYVRKLQAWALNRHGEIMADTGQDQEALKDFDEAVGLDSTNWRALHNRAVSYATKTQYAEAAADFDEVIKLKPDFASAWFNRGELRSQNGDFEAAIQDYDEALNLNADDAATLVGRGHAYYQLGKNSQALKDYDRALQLDKNRAAPYLYRAAALAEEGRFGEAADDYRQAIRLEPKAASGYQAAAWLMATCPDQQFRDAKLALKAARKAIELRGHDDCRDQETLAAAQAADGDYVPAAASQKRAIELAGSDEEELLAPMRQRLKLYEGGQPYLEARRTEGKSTTKR